MNVIAIAVFTVLPFISGRPVSQSVETFGVLLTAAGRDLSSIRNPIACEYEGFTLFPGEDPFEIKTGCTVKVIQCGVNGRISTSAYDECKLEMSYAESTTETENLTTATTTTPITTPAVPDCLFDDISYSPGQEIYEGSHENWCFGAICSDEGKIITWSNFNCTTTMHKEKKLPVRIQNDREKLPTGCIFEGSLFLPGEIIKLTQLEHQCEETKCGPLGIEKSIESKEC